MKTTTMILVTNENLVRKWYWWWYVAIIFKARPDRDKYVEILKDNISPRYLADFNITSKELVTSRGFPYDYESVMHYSEKAFTNIGEPTIKVSSVCNQSLAFVIHVHVTMFNL